MKKSREYNEIAQRVVDSRSYDQSEEAERLRKIKDAKDRVAIIGTLQQKINDAESEAEANKYRKRLKLAKELLKRRFTTN